MLLDDEEPIVEPPTKKLMPDAAAVKSINGPATFKRVGGDGVAKLKALKFHRGQIAASIDPLPMQKQISPVSVHQSATTVYPTAPCSPPTARTTINDAVSPQPAAPPPPPLEASAAEASRSVASNESTPGPVPPAEVPKKKMVQATLSSFFAKKSASTSS